MSSFKKSLNKIGWFFHRHDRLTLVPLILGGLSFFCCFFSLFYLAGAITTRDGVLEALIYSSVSAFCIIFFWSPLYFSSDKNPLVAIAFTRKSFEKNAISTDLYPRAEELMLEAQTTGNSKKLNKWRGLQENISEKQEEIVSLREKLKELS